jgi:hypothetical protein
MNVEKTIGFIRARQAKSVALQNRTDRRLKEIAKLLRRAAKTMLKIKRLGKKRDSRGMRGLTAKLSIAAPAEAKKRTERRLARTEERWARSDEKFERLLAALLRKRADGRR